MLNRPEYKKLVKMLKDQIEDQKSSGLVAITKGLFTFTFRGRDFDQSWPRALKECGLVDDGTHTETFTIPGFGFKDLYGEGDVRDPLYRARVSERMASRFLKEQVDQPGEIYDYDPSEIDGKE